MDEHRIGLKPILRRVWAPKGATVHVPVAQRYEWMYVFAFVHPQSGQTCWLVLPAVSVEVFSLTLAAFAEEVGAGPNKQIVLVLDRAGWHRSAHLKLPEGLHLVFLPPYSPELQPGSCGSGRSPTSRWPIGSSPPWMSWKRFKPSGAAGAEAHSEVVQAHTCFHWWTVLLDST